VAVFKRYVTALPACVHNMGLNGGCRYAGLYESRLPDQQSALFQQFGMSTYEGVVTNSQSAYAMNTFFYKRLWSEMRKYFIAPRQKKLNSIKQLIVYSIVLAVRCIGTDGDIRNESGRGRL
jgi:hypothetical protein